MYQLLESGIRRSIRWPLQLTLIFFPRSEHNAARYFIYGHLRRVLSDLGGGGEALSVSGSAYLASFLRPDRIVEASYPEKNILDLDFESNRFDYVVSDQVLEHVEGDPFRAIAECSRVLKPGGLVIHTSTFAP